MVLPALLVGVEAIRSNPLERRALEALGESMARTRTYAELETAMFDQSESSGAISAAWIPPRGRSSGSRARWWTTGSDRWRAELKPEEVELADGVARIQRQIQAVARQRLPRSPTRGTAQRRTASAQRELKGRLQPALTADEPGDLSPGARVQRAAGLRPAGGDPRRRRPHAARRSSRSRSPPACSAPGSSPAAWPGRSRELSAAMAVVGGGQARPSDPAPSSRDEIGDLARRFRHG